MEQVHSMERCAAMRPKGDRQCSSRAVAEGGDGWLYCGGHAREVKAGRPVTRALPQTTEIVATDPTPITQQSQPVAVPGSRLTGLRVAVLRDGGAETWTCRSRGTCATCGRERFQNDKRLCYLCFAVPNWTREIPQEVVNA